MTEKRAKTEQQRLVLEYLFDKDVKGDLRKSMQKAGYSNNTPLRDVMIPLGDEIDKAIKTYIARSAAKAAFEMIEVLDEPVALGNKNKMVAAKDVMDRAGYNKTDKVEVITESPLFILPPKDV